MFCGVCDGVWCFCDGGLCVGFVVLPGGVLSLMCPLVEKQRCGDFGAW